MSEWLIIAGWTLLAGVAIPAGGALASVERIQPRWLEEEFRHAVIAFGGGALLSAVSLVLVPEGIRALPPVVVAGCFLGGALAFLGLDLQLAKSEQPMAQLTAMISDFAPEALALGATFSARAELAPLLAGIIALQNLPEGFNAFRELKAATSWRKARILGLFTLFALLGPAAGLLGYFCLSAFPAVISAIMLFAAGGILYLVFQDIAPAAKLERRWAPPLGAVAGFLLGLLGQMLSQA